MSLAGRTLVFTVIVPGAGGVYVPWLILTVQSLVQRYPGAHLARSGI